MINILFVCHGNICRSPMAEYIMKDKIKKRALLSQIYVSSRATSGEEIGNDIYPPAKKVLREHQIHFDRHHASQITKNDYHYYDYILVMDYYNLSNIKRIVGEDKNNKIHMLLEYTNLYNGEISDPWYSGNFDRTYSEIDAACEGLLDYIIRNH